MDRAIRDCEEKLQVEEPKRRKYQARDTYRNKREVIGAEERLLVRMLALHIKCQLSRVIGAQEVR